MVNERPEKGKWKGNADGEKGEKEESLSSLSFTVLHIGMAVCRSLGDHYIKALERGFTGEPSISDVHEVSSGDVMVMASDGLWDVISGKHAVDLVYAEPQKSAQELASKLVTTVLQNPKCQDNVTVVVVRF
jgi:serine/threonine protein phosphatase PrpC